MANYFWPTVLLSVPLVGYYGYYYLKNKLDNYIIVQVMKKLDEMGNAEEVKFQPFQRTRSAMVMFEHGGKQHRVCIPYDRTKSRAMLRKKVYLIRGNDKIEITHKPGVPYLLSAKDMGGNNIVVEKDKEIIHEYCAEDAPAYL